MANQKNKVGGDISHIAGNVRFGDNDIQIHTDGGPPIPKELTVRVPRLDPQAIIGREADLVKLHESLFTRGQVVVVNGLGGIGKTTLVQAYLTKYYEEYQHLAWVFQGSDNLPGEFVNTAGLIDSLHIESDGRDASQLFAAIVMGLKAIEGKPNLLVIDNAEESLSGYIHLLPGQPHWHLLATSRAAIEGFQPQHL